MHNILIGAPYVLGAIGFLAGLIGIVIGMIKLYVWVDDNFTAVGSWVLVCSLWFILLCLFAWEIGAVHHAY